MTRRATFTKAEVQRALRAARELDPQAIVEIATPGGTIRIIAGQAMPNLPSPADGGDEDTCDAAFGTVR